ncbi:MAG: diacylglycerol kinase family protein [Myxococcota bacterium]
MRIGVLSNRRAGKQGGRVGRVLQLAASDPSIVHVETDSASAVPEALLALARQGVDVLAVNGGDGTLQRALTSLLRDRPFESLPWVAPLRSGRTNMAAIDLGATRNPTRGLQALVRAAASRSLEARAVRRPVLQVQLGPRRELHVGMFFGTGVVFRTIQTIHTAFPPGNARGALGGGLMIAMLVVQAARRHMEGILSADKMQIQLDGEPLGFGEYSLVMATSLRRLFLGIRPFWGREARPVRFTAISSQPDRVSAAAVGILRGRPRGFVTPEKGYTSRNVNSAQLNLHCGLTIDGELFEPEADRIVRVEADRGIRFVRA